MIKDFEKLKLNYARLLVNRGLNIPKGRIIKIVANLDQPDFVNTLVNECYNAGAKLVKVEWTHTAVDRIFRERTNIEELGNLPSHIKEEIKYDIENHVSYIYLESEDPNYLNGVDSKRASLPNIVRRAYVSNLRGEKMYRAPYTIACVPSVAWAKLLFPSLSEKAAVERFWETIFKVCHVNAKNPYHGWDEHCKDIDNHARKLNALNIKSLHYTSKDGTDLIVGMTNRYQFAGTADRDMKSKNKYYSNIPTEECFVSPHRLLTEGTVVSSKPLCVAGQLIEGIKLEFKKGRIEGIHADKNENLLKELINSEENMHYLGEIALVPYSSLINRTRIIFYNTLFDENACCHLAFGNSYAYTYRGYETMNKSTLFKRGLNQASNHIDFMIGTKDLKIEATLESGRKVIIFNCGEWGI